MTPQALSVSSDGGSVEGLGESFSPLLSSGTATFSVPVSLRPGRRGTLPGLSFSYSSSSGNGVLGSGGRRRRSSPGRCSKRLDKGRSR
ncbi:MAG: hypothetical protein HYY06_01065 [Deltaproteobacteria bacterium]|nr:hypothetical protein [Deltaproteobacteria bacterium]